MSVDVRFLIQVHSIKSWIQKVIKTALLVLNVKKDVSVVIVGDKKIQELNKLYRKKNKVTDVLSFGDWNDAKFLGEIFISLPQARCQAKEYGFTVKKEIARLLIHGVLHLVGYEHEKSLKEEKRMFKKQESILKKIK